MQEHRSAVWLVSMALVAIAAPGAAQPASRPDLDAIAGAASASRGLEFPAARRGSELDRALAARDWERAERLLVAQIEKDPTSSALLKTLAMVFMVDRKPLNAAIALKKADAIAPLDAESRFRLAIAYIAMRRGDWARPELERLAREQPASAIYEYWLGRLDYDAGQYQSAISRLKLAAERDPAFPRTFDNLGLCYEALNEPGQALVHYREAVRLNRLATEQSPWPALNLGILLRRRGDLAEAESMLREAVALDARVAAAHYQLGTLLEQTGRVDDAIDELRRASSSDAGYAEPHYALARIYRRQGRVADADAALATFQRLSAQARDGPR